MVAATPPLRDHPSNGVFLEFDSDELAKFYNAGFREVPDAAGVAARAAERGVRIGVISPGRLRAVTHLDVSGDDIDEAIERLRNVT